MDIFSYQLPAKPRNKRRVASAFGIAGGNTASYNGGGVISSSFWSLVTEDDEGNELEQPYLRSTYPVSVEVEGGGYLQLGRLRWLEDTANKAWKAEGSRGEATHVYATGGISALGYSGMGGEGETGGGSGSVMDLSVSGAGNAITELSLPGDRATLYAVKGATFALQSEFLSHTGSSTVHITSAERNNWNALYTNSHTHSNKNYLDLINQDLSISGSPAFASYVQIGSIRLVYDSASNALKVQTSTGAAANFYATGGVSALGYSGTIGGGGSGSGSVMDLSVSGAGNAITELSLPGDKSTLYAVKGLAFALQSDLLAHANNTAIHITSTERSNWSDSYTQRHNHSNKNYLDLINQDLSTSGSPAFASFVQIGSIRLIYDPENNAIKVQASTGNAANIYATGGVSTLGYSDAIGGGGSGSVMDLSVSGAGNAITELSLPGDKSILYAVKGVAFALQSDLLSHTNNTTIHITSTERSNWNTAYTNSHTHTNKTVLDGITSTLAANWNDAYGNSHTHGNKTVLDGITSTLVSNWNTAYTNSHTHSNKTVLDGITSALVSNWNDSYTQRHTHSNKSYLDLINQDLSTSGNPTFASYVQIGSIRLVYDSTNNAIKVQTSVGGNANFYATGGVSALGYATGGSGGGSGSMAWADITGKPNIISTLSASGTGNVVTGVTLSGTALTVTYGNITAGAGSTDWANVTNKPSWITTAKPTYSWTEITGKPAVLSSIGYSTSGSGNVVTGVTASGSNVNVTYGNISGGGPVSDVLRQIAPSGTITSYTNVRVRCGYRVQTGSIPAGNIFTFMLYDLSPANTLSITASIDTASDYVGKELVCTVMRESTNYRIVIYNPTSSSINVNNLRVNYIALSIT